MHIKKQVDLRAAEHTVWFAMGVWHALRHIIARKPLIVTSVNDGNHSTNSLHYKNRAFDVRTRDIPEGQRMEIVRLAREILDPLGFDIISKENAAHQDHDHCEFDPKPGEVFMKVLE